MTLFRSWTVLSSLMAIVAGCSQATARDGCTEAGSCTDGDDAGPDGADPGETPDVPDEDDGGDDGPRPDARTCVTAIDCNDLDTCNGLETCDMESRTCVDGAPPPDGSRCTLAGTIPGRCRATICVASGCGDGWLDAHLGEACDDGNVEGGDGCEADCRPTCSSDSDCREAPDDPCTVDACEPLEPPERGRVCRRFSPPDEETTCDFADDDCDGEVDEGLPRAVLPPGPVRITTTPERSRDASPAWNTANYIVGWLEGEPGAGGIRVQRVASHGSLLGTAERVDTAGAAASGPRLVWTSTRWAAAWIDARRGAGSADVMLATLDTAALREGPERVLSGPDARATGRPSPAWTGARLAAAWADSRAGEAGIRLRLAAEDGTPDPAGEIRVAESPWRSDEPRLAWTGTRLALAWLDGGAGAAREDRVRLVLLDAYGTPLGPDRSLTGPLDAPRDLDLAATASGLAAAWIDRRAGRDNLRVLFLDAEGNPLGPEVSPAGDADSASGPSLAPAGVELGIAWHDGALGGTEPAVGWLSAGSARLTGLVRIGDHPAPSRSGSLAFAGSAYGLAWTDERDGNEEIYFARVGCAP